VSLDPKPVEITDALKVKLPAQLIHYKSYDRGQVGLGSGVGAQRKRPGITPGLYASRLGGCTKSGATSLV
jgi:hypothetical protein